MKETFNAWAIETNATDIGGGYYTGFLGRHWFSWGMETHSSNLGCRAALFETRRLARHHLEEMKSANYVAYPNARIRRVKVTISTI